MLSWSEIIFVADIALISSLRRVFLTSIAKIRKKL